jgi:hypothetical protein
MESVMAIGRSIESAWRKENYDERVFPALTAEHLTGSRDRLDLRPEDVARWLATAGEIPRTVRTEPTFGESPLTCYSTEHFYVEILLSAWEGTTAVRQQGFSGAFRVLAGRSIHSRHRFLCRDRTSARFMLGDVHLVDSELLGPGDVRPVRLDDEHVQSLFQLESPSMNVVVRTYQDSGRAPQYDYLPPHIARDPYVHPPNERMSRLLRLYDMLAALSSSERVPVMTEYLESADLHSSFLVLERQVATRPAEREELSELLKVVRRRHGEVAAARVESVLDDMRRDACLLAARKMLRTPEHKLFMDLLRVGRDAETIIRWLGERYPGEQPRELILRWLTEISEVTLEGERAPSPLGLVFGQVEVSLFQALLLGQSMDDAISVVKKEYEVSEAGEEQLVTLVRTIASSVILRPLLPNWRADQSGSTPGQERARSGDRSRVPAWRARSAS